ncbi:MAG: DNA internalization-related competence protein ComEC/Rec2 [Candidatus Cloacimonadaceae bacterium]|nr:DNA internalization-related competence protein ComEC/Rec2 [Candidatus Cloacimonadaceae bacterium]
MDSLVRKPYPAPLLLPLALWCIGIVLSRSVLGDVNPLVLIIPAMILGLGAFVCKRYSLFPLILLIVLLGAMRYQMTRKDDSILSQILSGQTHIQQYAVFEVSKEISSTAFEIRLIKLAEHDLDERLILFSDNGLQPGKRYRAMLEILPQTSDPILDIFPQRYPAKAYVRIGLEELSEASGTAFTARWRSSLKRNLEHKLGQKANMALALLLSDPGAKADYREPMTRGGIVHLIVVSGLHVWFIYLISMVLLNLLLPRKMAEALFLVLICLFAALNHWSPPVMRAVLMIALFIFARWFSRPVSKAQVLAISLFIVTMIDPAQLFGVSLQLSYLCVGIIMLAVPELRLFKREPIDQNLFQKGTSRLAQYGAMTLWVSIGVIPLTLYYFGTGSLNGIVGNLVAIPLMGLILPLSFLVLILPAGSFALTLITLSWGFLMMLFDRWVELCAALPLFLQNAHIAALQVLGMILIILPLMLWIKQRKGRQYRHILPVCALGLLLFFIPLMKHGGGAGIYIFDAGTADCILIKLKDGNTILIDTGASSRAYGERQPSQEAIISTNSWARKKLLPWLGRKGIRVIDLLILTHLHDDHIGGVPALATNMPIKNIAVTDETLVSPVWKAWMEQNWFAKSALHAVTDTMSIFVGGAKLKFLHPDSTYFGAKENNRSIVLRLDYAGSSYLFPADIEHVDELHLIENHGQFLDVDYFKAAHHGSKSSNSADFLRVVSPREVWITASVKNRYGFPHQEPMRIFKHHAQRIRSTATGTIYLPFSQKD